MKKSLSLLLAVALVFSMFGSLAYAADENLTTEQKYQIQADLGIYSGINGEPALDQPMTRAQFARVAALIRGLDGIGNPDTRVVTEKPFPDVEVDAWYAEEVEAVKEAGLMQGDGTNFNPDANITIQELAVVLVALLDLEPVEGAEVEGAADWAAGYIQALLDNGVDFPTNYTEPALRADLVEASYVAADVYGLIAPDKVSVVSAKAVGVSKVEVNLDKAVDTEKAKLELKLANSAVALEKVEWSSDKKTATLHLKDTKIREGQYTVTLSGLEADEIDVKSYQFNGENETVTKLEFVTAGDEIAKSEKAQIKVRPENQYGEVASFSVSKYTVNIGTDNVPNTKKVDDEGYLIITLNTSNKNTGLDMIPVYVYFNDSRVTANKTFRVGSIPFVNKLELGEVSYSSEDKALVKSGTTATIPVYLYDQYGNPVTPEQAAADNMEINWNHFFTPWTDAIDFEVDDKDDKFTIELAVKANKKIEKTASYQLSVYAGGATGTTTIDVKSVRVAKTVEIGSPTKTIAAGDKEAFIPIYVYDENGNQLTIQEIVDNHERIKVTPEDKAELVRFGKNKGKIKYTGVPTTKNAWFSVSVMIESSIGEAPGYDNAQFQVSEARVPARLQIDTEAAPKSVLADATSSFKVFVLDQYGEKLDSTDYTPDKTYSVSVSVTGAVYHEVNGKDSNPVSFAADATQNFTLNHATHGFKHLHDGFEFKSKSVGKTQVKYVLKEGTDELSTRTIEIENIEPDSDLTYTLQNIGELYATLDNKEAVTDGTPAQIAPTTSKLAKEVKIDVRDASNKKVAYPNKVKDIVTSNNNVAQVNDAGGKGYVIGNKAGEANITVYVEAADGSVKALSSKVTVKADPIVVTSIETKDEVKFNGNIANVWEATDIKVKTQYGNEFKKDEVADYSKALGVRFAVSDIEIDGAGTTDVTIDYTTKQITIGTAVKEFTLTAISSDGEVTSQTLLENFKE